MLVENALSLKRQFCNATTLLLDVCYTLQLILLNPESEVTTLSPNLYDTVHFQANGVMQCVRAEAIQHSSTHHYDALGVQVLLLLRFDQLTLAR